MNTIRQFYLFLILFLIIPVGTYAQESESDNTIDAVSYRTEVFGSAASGDYTPFWMVSNRYGKVPLNSGNFFLEAGVFQQQHFGKGFWWTAGLDMVVSAPRERNVYLQQIYAEIGYQAFLLSIGSKEKYNSLWNKKLSTGDLVQSTNARPIPEINLSIPHFTVFPGTKGWLQIKGDFALGRSFDTKYIKDFVNEKQHYVLDVLWHHKSLFLRIEDTRNNFPLSLDLGIQHWAQWGGSSTYDRVGKQPQSLKDFVRIVFFKEGGDSASTNDKHNVLGNHYGSYDMRLNYTTKDWSAHIYHQRFFEDKSGTEFKNGWDGLWGMEMKLSFCPWVNNLVFEIIDTRNQSGPFHFINFDHDAHPGRGGGNDNYYNNGEYYTGVSYFNRGIGSPLIPAPEYNTDGSLGFKNNRIKDWHIGLNGNLSPYVSYRFLFTAMNGWGKHYEPFFKKRKGTSTLIDISYQHPHLIGWQFTGSVAADTGTFLDKGIGFSLGIRKNGILKAWN